MHFEIVSDWNSWVEEERVDGLLLALRGNAADLMYGYTDCRKKMFTELCCVLSERFGALSIISEDKKRLMNRKKQLTETCQHLGQEIAKIMKRIYAGSPEIAEREARDCYIHALPEKSAWLWPMPIVAGSFTVT